MVYSASAVCVFSSKLEAMGGPCNNDSDCVKRKFMKLEGIGKYPHITVNLFNPMKKATSSSKHGENTVSDTSTKSTLGTRLLNGSSINDGTDLIDRDLIASGSGGDETLVDFGEVAVGRVIKKKIEITNVSPVRLARLFAS